MTDKEILESVSEHTGALKAAAWLKNIRRNQDWPKIKSDISLLTDAHKNEKAVVIGAGPGFKRFGCKDLRKLRGRDEIVKISCDGALQTLCENGVEPDYVVSVDCHPVVANFYRRTRFSKPPKFLLSTTVHRDVVKEIVDKYGEENIFWFQSFRREGEVNSMFGGGRMEKFFVEGISTIWTGGNVGTTSYVMSHALFGCKPIGLLGLEFTWSDETPLMTTQYYDQLMKILRGDTVRVKQHFKRIVNKRDGKTYVADPVYYAYLLAFRELWRMIPICVHRSTFNLTVQGILSARGLQTIDMDEFLEK